MNKIPKPSPSETQHYCVWFASGADPEQLLHIPATIQLQQDLLIVEAHNEHDALVRADELLREKCEFDSFITRVFDRAELLRMLDVLDRVDAGKLAPATEMDLDHLVWFERYLVPPGPPTRPE